MPTPGQRSSLSVWIKPALVPSALVGPVAVSIKFVISFRRPCGLLVKSESEQLDCFNETVDPQLLRVIVGRIVGIDLGVIKRHCRTKARIAVDEYLSAQVSKSNRRP